MAEMTDSGQAPSLAMESRKARGKACYGQNSAEMADCDFVLTATHGSWHLPSAALTFKAPLKKSPNRSESRRPGVSKPEWGIKRGLPKLRGCFSTI